jgi:hypothetical protein
VHLLHAGGGEVVDGDRVGSAPAGDVEPLDGVELVAAGEGDLIAGRRASSTRRSKPSPPSTRMPVNRRRLTS